jgi:quinol monooxygenase YgiN
MLHDMTAIFAILKGKPEYADEVEKDLLILHQRTSDEPGARGYAVHRRGETFLVYERYVDQAACDAHFAAPYVKEFLARSEQWLTNPPQIEVGSTLASFHRP